MSLPVLVNVLVTLPLVLQLHSSPAAFDDHRHKNLTLIEGASYDGRAGIPFAAPPNHDTIDSNVCSRITGKTCSCGETCCCTRKFIVCLKRECCPLPNAVCCSTYCCVPGYTCADPGCAPIQGESNFLEMIVDKLSPSSSPEVQANAAENTMRYSPSSVSRIWALALEDLSSKSVWGVVCSNVLVSGLVRDGDLEGARKLFDEMLKRNFESWIGRQVHSYAYQVFDHLPQRDELCDHLPQPLCV
ncbi:hypothetical protein Droror1_Dr00007439 [Drosera rotundifolia]